MRITGTGLVALALSCSSCGDDLPSSDVHGSTGLPADASTSGTTAMPPDASTTADASGDGDGSSDDGGTTGEPIDPPPPCGSHDYEWTALVAGPGRPDHDEALQRLALRHDRLHVGLTSLPAGLAADIRVAIDDEAAREAIASFLDDDDAWDFEAATGLAPTEAVVAWNKATGAFAGVAAAADAYRYGTLRDQGDDCEAIDRAREHLVRVLDGLHLTTALTGEPGLVVRAIAHRDWPGDGDSPTTPLFDADGDPLPPEKNNGTWREDLSGEHPELVWEDSCSRDQLIGWAIGYGAAWEVIRHDPTIDQALKDRLQADAAAIVEQLATVRDSGYDLEIWDPEGRPTLHGYLHEHNVEGMYLQIFNGFHAAMASGIVGGLAWVAERDDLTAYLEDELLADRDLTGVAASSTLVDFAAATNYSNYNMGFDALWLTGRYLEGQAARADMAVFGQELYATRGALYQPIVAAQSFFDLAWAATVADASAWTDMPGGSDGDAVARALDTMHRFPPPPAYVDTVTNCDPDEIAAMACTLDDGTTTTLLGPVGHNDELVATDPVPIEIRPRSNFEWRSNPYRVNGEGDGELLPSSADFRFAYWLGRWTRVQ